MSKTLIRRIFFPLAAMSLALIATCLCGEIGLRLCGYNRSYLNPIGSFHWPDPVTGCRGKPNFTGRFRTRDFDVVVSQDELGFRRREEHPGLPHMQHDLYVLGDSFVWGYGVGQQEVFTNQMEPLLPGYRVHNLGLIGAGTVEEYTLFKTYVYDHLRPGDQVLLALFGNDFGDNVGRYLDERLHATIDADGKITLVPPRAGTFANQLKSEFKDWSCLFNLVTYCIDRYRDSGSHTQDTTKATRIVPSTEAIVKATSDDSAEVRITRHFLAELKKACDEKQAKFTVAYIPGEAELGEDDIMSTGDLSPPEELAYRQAFERITKSLNITTIDLLPAMLDAKRTKRFERLSFPHDFHWNAAGHTVAAEAICKGLK